MALESTRSKMIHFRTADNFDFRKLGELKMPLSRHKFHLVANVIRCSCVLLLLQVPSAFAHHSYAMIDNSRVLEVTATVAKLEWVNPHIFLWAYVADESQESGYQLYAFEAGSITMMTKAGWTRDDTVKVGEKVTIEYLPLRNGKPGGSLGALMHADGSITPGDFPAVRFLEKIKAKAAEKGEQ
jgi:hypothetical protein